MFKELAIRMLGHRLGWKTNRKLLLIESDDWGALYLPNALRTQRLIESKILAGDEVGYARLDCLETREDLERLCNVLVQFTDCRGRYPKFTFNTVMGNPDFEKIRQSNFEEYVHQPFFETYVEYTGEDLKPTWLSAMEQGLVVPQFHAREHVNVPRWMRELRANREDTRISFDNHYYALRRSTISPVDYLTAYWPDSPEDLQEIEGITTDGLNRFKQVFGFSSKSFVACCYVLPNEIESCTAQAGVKLIQTQRRYRMPTPKSGGSQFCSRVSGWRNEYGQVYSIRNVFFEPALETSTDWVNLALNEVSSAFAMGRPAVVCSHRVNYVGSKDKQQRNSGLEQLKRFLTVLVQRFPDIEFLGSDELLEVMEQR